MASLESARLQMAKTHEAKTKVAELAALIAKHDYEYYGRQKMIWPNIGRPTGGLSRKCRTIWRLPC